jgi:hypothetical protein
MLPVPAPKGEKIQGLTEWQKHWLKIAQDNPQLKTNRARNKLANEEWLKTHPRRYSYKLGQRIIRINKIKI